MHLNQLFILLCIAGFTFPSAANQLYVSFDQNQQAHVISDSIVLIDTTGNTITASMDIGEGWQWSLNAGQSSGDAAFDTRATAQLDTRTLSSTLTYYNEAWSYSINIARYSDDLRLIHRDNREVYSSVSNSPSISASAQYQFPINQWFIELDAGISYGKYDSDSTSNKDKNQTITIKEDAGNIAASFGVTASYWTELTQQSSLLLGTSLYWDQVINSDNEATRVQATRTRQPQNPRRWQLEGGFQSESAGQLSVFASYGFATVWSISASYARPVNSDYNNDGFALMLGYQF
jgi:hypothetical protein